MSSGPGGRVAATDREYSLRKYSLAPRRIAAAITDPSAARRGEAGTWMR